MEASPRPNIESLFSPLSSGLCNHLHEIVFNVTGANVTACVQIEAFVKNEDGSVLSVLVVNSSLTLPAAISVVSSKLKIALSISENVLALVSSSVGITD
ncbi:hypothetical protein JD844_019394, partial [Phrynosoma platyrhinos]